MDLLVASLAFATSILGAAALARRIGGSAPLLLLVIGVIGSYLPFVAEPRLSPELILIGVLPPLLYATASTTSLVDFRKNAPAIGWLSIGLVLFTAAGVGLVLWALLEIPYGVAFALGAVVAPPDAVAATAVARQIGLPRKVVTILEGESLVNDATALVSLRTAVNAVAASVSVVSVLVDFATAVAGAVLTGLIAAKVVGAVMRRTRDTVTLVTLTFVAPFVAYAPAEAMHASGVLSVVVAGLALGQSAPVVSTATARVCGRITWTTIQFLLENAVFLLIGLQMRRIVAETANSGLSVTQLVVAVVATLGAVIVLRIGWVFATRLLGRVGLRASGRERSPAADTIIISWAGMRGVVTLAAALTLPEDFPHRSALVLIALAVTVGTLLLQGLTLPWLAKRVGARAPDPREDALQEAMVLQRTLGAGLAELDHADTTHDAAVVERLRSSATDRLNAAWERLGRADAQQQTPTDQYRLLRGKSLQAERAELLRIRSEGNVDQEVLTSVLATLDIEESILQVTQRLRADEQTPPLTPQLPSAPCVHLRDAPPGARPTDIQGCHRCLAEGTRWVHLRMCLDCGEVGCCDSSPGRHASAHYEQTGHPVMRSIEAGESWRWCYVDEVVAGAAAD